RPPVGDREYVDRVLLLHWPQEQRSRSDQQEPVCRCLIRWQHREDCLVHSGHAYPCPVLLLHPREQQRERPVERGLLLRSQRQHRSPLGDREYVGRALLLYRPQEQRFRLPQGKPVYWRLFLLRWQPEQSRFGHAGELSDQAPLTRHRLRRWWLRRPLLARRSR